MTVRGLLVLLGTLGLASPAMAQRPVVVRIPITGVIENGLAPYVARALEEAKGKGAAAVVLDIDTPGGRVDAAQRIVDAVRASEVPVTAWVHPRAFSAGAMIALSAERILMTSGAVLGAATPVDGQGTKGTEKIVSAMRAEFRALAEARGRDPAVAEAMVDETLGVDGLVAKGQLVTLTTAQAIEREYAEGTAESLDAVLATLDLTGAEVLAIDPNWAETLLRFLTHPVVSPLLLSLGILGLVFEIKAGAFGIGGLVSMLSLGLFFGSSFLLGLAGWEEVILLGLGIIALGVEVLVLPGFGVAGVLGTLFIGGAVVMAMLGAGPSTGDIVGALAVLGVSLVITASVFFAWLRHLPSSNRFRGLLLRDATDRAEGYIASPERHDLVGVIGRALTDLRPAGTAEMNGERMDVVTQGEYIASGATVVVVRSEGYRHVVRAADVPAAAQD